MVCKFICAKESGLDHRDPCGAPGPAFDEENAKEAGLLPLGDRWDSYATFDPDLFARKHLPVLPVG